MSADAALRRLFETHAESDGPVIPSMAVGDVRYFLNGINVEVGPKRLSLVATDGHRLSVAEEDGGLADAKQTFLVPAAAAKTLAQRLADSDESASVWCDEHHVGVEVGPLKVVTKRLIGTFPDWRAVLAPKSDTPITVDRAGLESVLKRALIISGDNTVPKAQLSAIGKGLVIEAEADQENAHETVDADYRGQGVEVGFNGRYLLDAISTVDGERVVLHASNPERSALVHGEGESDACRHTVMPVRL
jgi:DNA polymerase-3 subunit beta